MKEGQNQAQIDRSWNSQAWNVSRQPVKRYPEGMYTRLALSVAAIGTRDPDRRRVLAVGDAGFKTTAAGAG